MSEPKSELIGMAELLLRCEAIRLAARDVLKEWDSGLLTALSGFSAGITVECLRDALNGYIPEDVLSQLNDGDE